MIQIPLSKARAVSHEWAYRFSPGDAYRRSPDGEPLEIVPGTECRNTGCCDADGRPVFEHDYVKKWFSAEHPKVRHGNTYAAVIFCEVGEILYAGDILVKRVAGLPDAPLPYQYLHDPRSPLMLCFNEVVGNSIAQRRNTFRKSESQLLKEHKIENKKTKKKKKNEQLSKHNAEAEESKSGADAVTELPSQQ